MASDAARPNVANLYWPMAPINTIEELTEFERWLKGCPTLAESQAAVVVFRTSELPRLADTTVSNSSPSEAVDVSLPGCLICFSSTWTCRSGSRVIALMDGKLLECGFGPFHSVCLAQLVRSANANPGNVPCCPLRRREVSYEWASDILRNDAAHLPSFMVVRAALAGRPARAIAAGLGAAADSSGPSSSSGPPGAPATGAASSRSPPRVRDDADAAAAMSGSGAGSSNDPAPPKAAMPPSPAPAAAVNLPSEVEEPDARLCLRPSARSRGQLDMRRHQSPLDRTWTEPAVRAGSS